MLCSGLTLLQNESISATKAKLRNICYAELRKHPAYLIFFLLQGEKKSLFILELELRIEGSQK